jgi:hypothetical protein
MPARKCRAMPTEDEALRLQSRKDKAMEPRMPTKVEPAHAVNEDKERQSFVRQVEDRALQAADVLREQREGKGPDAPVRVFVP